MKFQKQKRKWLAVYKKQLALFSKCAPQEKAQVLREIYNKQNF
jgi:RNA polymerase-interacting CarD/CdnL/TRCF family regulator